MKNRILISVVTTILLLGVAASIRWASLSHVRDYGTCLSPGGMLLAEVTTIRQDDFWGRDQHVRYYVSVRTVDRSVNRHVFIDEAWTGGSTAFYVEWATNGGSATFIFNAKESKKTCLTLDTTP